jgi:hypothetical protein
MEPQEIDKLIGEAEEKGKDGADEPQNSRARGREDVDKMPDHNGTTE